MRTAKSIRFTIDIFLLLFIIICLRSTISQIRSFFETPTIGPNSMTLEATNYLMLIPQLLTIVYIILVFLGLYFFRKALKSMVNGSLFNVSVIRNLRKSGNYFLIVSLSVFLLYLFSVFNWIQKGKGFNLNYEGLVILFVVIFGLFLRLCATIFSTGKRIKEENELTI